MRRKRNPPKNKTKQPASSSDGEMSSEEEHASKRVKKADKAPDDPAKAAIDEVEALTRDNVSRTPPTPPETPNKKPAPAPERSDVAAQAKAREVAALSKRQVVLEENRDKAAKAAELQRAEGEIKRLKELLRKSSAPGPSSPATTTRKKTTTSATRQKTVIRCPCLEFLFSVLH